MDDLTGWMLVAAVWMWLIHGVRAAWKARPRQTDQEPRPATFLLGIGSAVASALFLGSVVATYIRNTLAAMAYPDVLGPWSGRSFGGAAGTPGNDARAVA